MNRISPVRVVLFVCVMLAIAFVVRSVQSRREEQSARAAAEVAEAERQRAAEATERERKTAAEALQKQAEQEAAQARRSAAQARQEKLAQDAAAEHERFLTRYLNTNVTRKAGNRLVAVAVVSEAGTMNHAIGIALVNRFQQAQVQLTASFFKPELVTDGLFAQAFNGSSELFRRLDLDKSLDALLLANQKIQYETNAGLNHIVTAAMGIQIVTLPVAGQSASESWTFTANGAGIRREEARIQAEERILQQISSDTKMKLNLQP